MIVGPITSNWGSRLIVIRPTSDTYYMFWYRVRSTELVVLAVCIYVQEVGRLTRRTSTIQRSAPGPELDSPPVERVVVPDGCLHVLELVENGEHVNELA